MTDDGKTTETVSKAEFEKVLSRAQQFEARVADFEKKFAGIDPEAAKAHKEEVEILRRESVKADPKKLEEYEGKVRAELDKRYGATLTEKEQALNKALGELKELRVVDKAVAEASKHFRPEALDIVRMLAQKDLDHVDGKIIVRGQDGKPLPSKANPRNDMDVGEWISNLVQTHSYAALPTAKAGGKEAGERGSASGATISGEEYLKMSQEDRAKLPIDVRRKLFTQVTGVSPGK